MQNLNFIFLQKTHTVHLKPDGEICNRLKADTKVYLRQIKDEWTNISWRNGKKHGMESSWMINRGHKKYERHYVDGIENGIRREWELFRGEFSVGSYHVELTYHGNYVDGAEE